ncbi:nucleoside-diphosphate sugar epimerase [Streptococcus dysgalactiae subsp. equisimilis]|nr:nucleoside-diphosphate sugar epimerase [Streptococcus dysgalactiae subsp. equisimilis]
MARRPHKVAPLPNATIHQANYDCSLETQKTLRGVDVLVMVSAHESLNRLEEHKAFIDAAKISGVRHIIYTSFYQASPNSTFTLARDHAVTEAYIKENGLTYTFLKDNFYLDFWFDLGLRDGELRGPAAEGKVSAVVRSDVAEVIATISQHPQNWENQTLNLTGPENLSLSVIAQKLSHWCQKSIPYSSETVPEAYASRQYWPAQDWEYDAWVSTYTAIAAGEQSGISPAIETVLGRPAKSLDQFLTENHS